MKQNQVAVEEYGNQTTVGDMAKTVAEQGILELSQLDPERTALIVVDMVEGFLRQGALHSDRCARHIPALAQLASICSEAGIPVVGFRDAHQETDPELAVFPSHCLEDEVESQIVPEIRPYVDVEIAKNSINGALEAEFASWRRKERFRDTFLITGVCTDLCVLQFALALKAQENHEGRISRLIVPSSHCDTYDLPGHPGDLCHLWALYNMACNGIETPLDIR